MNNKQNKKDGEEYHMSVTKDLEVLDPDSSQ